MTAWVWSPQAMARRSVRRSIRAKHRMDQVCGAKKRRGHADYLPLEQETTMHSPSLLPPLLVIPSIDQFGTVVQQHNECRLKLCTVSMTKCFIQGR